MTATSLALRPAALERVAAAVWRHRAGASQADAAILARHLVEADLAGHPSHGIALLPYYLDAIASGALVADAKLGQAANSGGLLVFDANRGPGHVMAHHAIERAAARAQAQGHCVLALRDAHHIGRIGTYAEQCAAHGLVSIHVVNVPSSAIVAPWGGPFGRLGTNPFAAGFPVEGGEPVLVDFATSRWAGGKVRVAMDNGKALPEGILLDETGTPTTDPAKLWSEPRGALLPMGEHKGYALALAIELLAGALLGGATQDGGTKDGAIVNSMLSMVFRRDAFAAPEVYEERTAALLAWVRGEAPEVMLPGEPERATRARLMVEGLPLDDANWAKITGAARLAGVPDAEIAACVIG